MAAASAENGNGSEKAARARAAGRADLPLGIIRSTKVKPKEGDRLGYIELQLRVPIEEEAIAAAGFLLELQRTGAPAAITIRASHKHDASAAAAALRRP